jgi:hypothetical protein
MNTHENPSTSGVRTRRVRQVRIVGLIVLLLGLGSAGGVYWLGTREPDLADDPMMLRYRKTTTRQMGLLFGRAGLMTDDATEALKRPGNQAVVIVAFSTIVSLGCFYFASWLESSD